MQRDKKAFSNKLLIIKILIRVQFSCQRNLILLLVRSFLSTLSIYALCFLYGSIILNNVQLGEMIINVNAY